MKNPLLDATVHDLNQTNHDFMNDDHHHVLPTNITNAGTPPKENDHA